MTGLAKTCAAFGLALAGFILLPSPSSAVAPSRTQASPPPTFSRDVLPIVQRSCQRCDRPDPPAAMSLPTYQRVRPWARSSKSRVTTRQMPPRRIDRNIGEYLDDLSLSDQGIPTISAWVDGGAPHGNPAGAPPPLRFTPIEEWVYGQPDLVVQTQKGFAIRSTGPDFLPSEVVDPSPTEDRDVKRIQIPPTAHGRVHHSPVYASTPEGADTEGLGLGTGSTIGSEVDFIQDAAGNDAGIFADGKAKLIMAGSRCRFSGPQHRRVKPWHI